MNYLREELLQALAGRYVTGVMGRRARRRFQQLLLASPEVRYATLAWEERLAPLAMSLPDLPPSELVWKRIERELGLSNSVGQARRSAPPGRWVAAAAVLLAGLGVTSLGWWQALQRPPQVVVETVRETVPEPASVAVVSNDSGDALWIARIYPASGQADVRVANAPQARPGNDYQLWALPEGGVPVSLGLLPQSGARDLVLSPAAQSALMRTATVAVSLEPPGGSPEPVPTGPVLFTAALLAP